MTYKIMVILGLFLVPVKLIFAHGIDDEASCYMMGGRGVFIWPVIFFLIVLLLLFLIPKYINRPTIDDDHDNRALLDLLKKRYVKGEISKKEYLEIKKDLNNN